MIEDTRAAVRPAVHYVDADVFGRRWSLAKETTFGTPVAPTIFSFRPFVPESLDLLVPETFRG